MITHKKCGGEIVAEYDHHDDENVPYIVFPPWEHTEAVYCCRQCGRQCYSNECEESGE